MEALSDLLVLILLVTAIPAVVLCAWAGWLVDRTRTSTPDPDEEHTP